MNYRLVVSHTANVIIFSKMLCFFKSYAECFAELIHDDVSTVVFGGSVSFVFSTKVRRYT